MKNLKFYFGASMGAFKTDIETLKSDYASCAAEAQRWLADVPFDAPGHGWMALPNLDCGATKEAAEWLRGYDCIVQAGIGGSALGNLMLNQALLDQYYNETQSAPKYYLADNPDPDKTRSIWERVKGKRTALVGVSKSGATAETMTQFLWLRSQMLENGATDGDILVITDPNGGIFRAFANASGCRSLELPASVGGRYSVLCAAGLPAAAALGIDVDALLSGAASMKKFLMNERSFDKNPAMQLAALHLYHEEAGRPMSVMMPYSSKMAYFAEWYAQLWAESLGKDGRGTTPVRALGTIDQHSQVQLYAAGPDDKFYTFISLYDHGPEVNVPTVACEALAPLSYLNGQGIGAMLNLEAQSTAAAIAKAGRPLVWIEMERLDARTLGSLVFFYEYLTALTGRMMGVDPFDQPGVEQGKRYTYGLMGRSGFEEDAAEVTRYFEQIKKITVCAQTQK